MRNTSFYTIRELDYKAIEEKLSRENVSEELKKDILIMIADHRAMVECKKKIIAEQTLNAEGLFGPLIDLLPPPNANEIPTENATNSSKNEDAKPLANDEEKSKKDDQRKKGGTGKKKLPLGNVINHSLTEEEKKCTSCGSKMHMERSKTRTYVLSLPMLSTETHVSESCRCLSCNGHTVAQEGHDLQNQCIGRYHFSAVASLAALRYQYGMASYRMEMMSDAIGIKVSDSTQWFLFEEAAAIVRTFVCYLEKEVANAPVHHIDDTNNIILDVVKEIEAEQELALSQGKNPNSVRSGIHTTNITAKLAEGEIVLYKTGLHHAGEVLAKILAKRTIDEQIIIMADAASSNTSKLDLKKDKNINVANCNSHAVRKFKELAEAEEELNKKFNLDSETSEPLNYFLLRYKIIFKNDYETKNLSPEERLCFHQKYSLPLMQEMKKRADEDIANKKIEPNSDLGKVYNYFSNNYKKLCAFCYLTGAPICNNVAERMLKSIIRHRKNSLFFKTQIGASVADILTTILFTAKANEVNSVEYLKNLLIHKELWKEKPEEWLPWNYQATINKLKSQPK